MIATIRKIGGSVMLVIPAAIAREMGVKEDSVVNLEFASNQLSVRKRGPRTAAAPAARRRAKSTARKSR